MERFIAGSRIRQIRRDRGHRQSDLAREIGISPSYLNLIEANKRPIAGALMNRIAEALGVESEELDSAFQRRLQENLNEIARMPEFSDLELEGNRAGEFIGRFPGWARGLSAMARQTQSAHAKIDALSDRLSNDPFMSEVTHRIVTGIASLRSAAEIIHDYPDAAQDQRKRFEDIIYEESYNLSQIAEALASYVDKRERAAEKLTPLDEVEAFVAHHRNHFPDLEDRADAQGEKIKAQGRPSHRESVERLCRIAYTDDLKKIVAENPALQTEAARNKLVDLFILYTRDAILMPLDIFTKEAERLRYDAEALANRFSVDFSLACRRLTTLKPEQTQPRFGYYRTNASGMILDMQGLPGLVWPRYTAACPLWILFGAQQTPGKAIRQLAIFPNGSRFIFVARAQNIGEQGFGQPRHFVSDMLAVTEADGARTVYNSAINERADEVGSSCRTCIRRRCRYRVEDPLLA